MNAVYPSKGDFLAFVGNLSSRSLVDETLSAFRRAGALHSIGAALPDVIDGVGWSDHWSFWQEGFPAVEITDTAPFRNPYYHTPQDTADRLNYDYLGRFAWAMRTVVSQASNAEPLTTEPAMRLGDDLSSVFSTVASLFLLRFFLR